MVDKHKPFALLNNIEAVILGVMISVAVIVIFMQIIMRYVFNNSLSWSEELARYLFIWFSWMGISLGQRRGEHISVTMLTDRLKPLAKKITLFVKDGITLAILVCLIVYGFTVVSKQQGMGIVTVALRIPTFIVYSSMPVGCVLMAIRIVYGFFRRPAEGGV